MIFGILFLHIKYSIAADLSEIKKRKLLIVGVKDDLYPFGFRNKDTKKIEGYDIDFANEIAKELDVKVEFKPVSSSDRIPLLKKDDVDMLICTMTITDERKKEIDFSYSYFISKQKFIVKKEYQVKELKDLEGKVIVTAKGSTSELNAKNALPSAKVLGFEDYPQAGQALDLEKVFAVTSDESVLVGVLSEMKSKEKFEITKFEISKEPYGIGVKQGSSELLRSINSTLLKLENSGEASKIYDKWFGTQTSTPLARDFKIAP
ncbi:hypothetical protein AXG55_03780 [Silvanigrella aquatica]|uniref:Amino acid ABC transporter substrate-binding protein n=1 Tax=Silvanigrella aquatica TaxID=1915309 RepID=A0A1L4D4G3_9BACT|nr:hypothetical protein AXG55_03780 [Silvanigrella aquatica]